MHYFYWMMSHWLCILYISYMYNNTYIHISLYAYFLIFDIYIHLFFNIKEDRCDIIQTWTVRVWFTNYWQNFKRAEWDARSDAQPSLRSHKQFFTHIHHLGTNTHSWEHPENTLTDRLTYTMHTWKFLKRVREM